jgi:mannose-6-phosphate isomerase
MCARPGSASIAIARTSGKERFLMPDKECTEHRPWGFFTVLADEPDHKVKRVVVHPGGRLSLQRHAHRTEHWYVTGGQGTAMLDGVPVILCPGDSIDIPCSAIHRIENEGTEDFIIIEVQTGDYFGEDDIERIEDDYGRG